MKKTVLIFGITSFVGSNFAEVLSEKFHVVGTYYTENQFLPHHYSMLRCNVLKKDEVKRAIKYFKPDYVIYAVGISSLEEAKLHAKEAEALNSTGAINCLNATERSGALFIYLSSAFVLSGENKSFKESDTPFPATTYGTAVANAEFVIQKSSLHYLILRCPVLYGLSYSVNKLNIFELIQKSVFEQKNFKLDDQVLLGFLDVQLVARFLILLLDESVVNRLLQISSKDHQTYYQFAKKYGQIFNASVSHIEATNGNFPQESKSGAALSFKMDVANTESRIGIKMPTIQESLEFSQRRFSAKSS